ncbi:MAG: hypothetical protein UY87_C0004G0017 [Candidatus Peribacteria bacterium GW2011_GWC2_54_8]|nr:MAG: hypothetical protein UY87_C0004G0017 [Candidatus Peribacteria bacterium GW2011_GWC2_54_8]
MLMHLVGCSQMPCSGFVPSERFLQAASLAQRITEPGKHRSSPLAITIDCSQMFLEAFDLYVSSTDILGRAFCHHRECTLRKLFSSVNATDPKNTQFFMVES